MKKLLVLTLTLASFGFLGLETRAAEVKANTAIGTVMNTPQIQIRLGQQRNRRYRRDWRVQTTRTTRIVRWGRATYRETYLVRYFPNGQTDTTLISRERIG
jgi:hypothetical protein